MIRRITRNLNKLIQPINIIKTNVRYREAAAEMKILHLARSRHFAHLNVLKCFISSFKISNRISFIIYAKVIYYQHQTSIKSLSSLGIKFLRANSIIF